MKIAVIALGSWGTAMANVLAINGYDVHCWARSSDLIEDIKRDGENKRYLPGVRLQPGIKFGADLAGTIKDAQMIVFAVPTQNFKKVFEEALPTITSDQVIVNLAKGIEIESGLTISRLALKIAGPNRKIKFAALSGPSHAEEVGTRSPTAVVASADDIEIAQYVQDCFSNSFLRVYTNTDLLGVEISGATKNIIALAAGVIDGLGYGDNAIAALITRGIHEITRFGIALGADPKTFSGLAGVGDMIVTCTSKHSRNRQCGYLIGRGASLSEAAAEVGMVVEGAHTCRAVAEMLVDMPDIEMPITQELYGVLYNGRPARDALNALMTRKHRHETDEVD